MRGEQRRTRVSSGSRSNSAHRPTTPASPSLPPLVTSTAPRLHEKKEMSKDVN